MSKMQAACEAVKFVLETWSKPNIDQRLEDDSQVATGLLENLDYCTTAYLLLLDVMMFTFSPMAMLEYLQRKTIRHLVPLE